LQELRLETPPLGNIEKRYDGAYHLDSPADWMRPVLDGKLGAVFAEKYFVFTMRVRALAKGGVHTTVAERYGSSVGTAVMMLLVDMLAQ
jgi:hypothetical protein